MENLRISASVVAPMLLMMLVGYISRRAGIVTEDTMRKVNKLLFRVFLPFLVFRNVYTSDISTAFSPKLLIFSICLIVGMYILIFFVVRALEKDNPKRGSLIQAIFRSNFIIFGIPVLETLYGAESTGVAAILIAVIIPLYNVLAVVTFEVHRGGKPDFKKILKGIITNPLIIASLLGAVVLLTGFQMPAILDEAISGIGKIATPLAFVILGSLFNLDAIRGGKKQIAIGLLGRLVIFPLIGLTIAVALGFTGPELAVIMIMCGSPPAVSSFTMAQQMDGDGELAGSLVILGSILSILSIFLITFILKTIGAL
ncbi:MAG: AEC family transporter [Oscillospiraceae bacterium]|nr:AEC family transporter [Oscillospiraceae bacterium]